MKAKAVIPLVFIVIAAVRPLFAQPGQDLSRYDVLKEPRIIRLPDQKMLVVEAKGDPSVASGPALGQLFKTFFAIPGARMAPPRSRWTVDPKTPKAQWAGQYALPVPDATTLPAGSGGAKIEVWEYGDVAEILHAGSYAEEPPTIQKLMKFIGEKGFLIAGPHEEEYLRGPESGPNTADYRTIIRYQVKKK
jgi:effector-binding domain-containing protein